MMYLGCGVWLDESYQVNLLQCSILPCSMLMFKAVVSTTKTAFANHFMRLLFCRQKSTATNSNRRTCAEFSNSWSIVKTTFFIDTVSSWSGNLSMLGQRVQSFLLHKLISIFVSIRAKLWFLLPIPLYSSSSSKLITTLVQSE